MNSKKLVLPGTLNAIRTKHLSPYPRLSCMSCCLQRMTGMLTFGKSQNVLAAPSSLEIIKAS